MSITTHVSRINNQFYLWFSKFIFVKFNSIRYKIWSHKDEVVWGHVRGCSHSCQRGPNPSWTVVLMTKSNLKSRNHWSPSVDPLTLLSLSPPAALDLYMLRDQVETCLGLYVMSDWPDDLRLCVSCVCVHCVRVCVPIHLKWCVADTLVMSGW
jgi:hypothetical protein